MCIHIKQRVIGNSWNWKLKMKTENSQNILIGAFLQKPHLKQDHLQNLSTKLWYIVLCVGGSKQKSVLYSS